jgi:hypothetical protein
MRKKQNRRDYAKQFKTDAVKLVLSQILSQNYLISKVGPDLVCINLQLPALVREYEQRSEDNGSDPPSA